MESERDNGECDKGCAFSIVATVIVALGILLLVATLQVWPPPSAPKVEQTTAAEPATGSTANQSPESPPQAAHSPTQSPAPASVSDASKPFSILGYDLALTPDKHFLIVIFLVGALSSIAMLLRSLAVHHGRGDFSTAWVPYYLLTPLAAGVTAMMVVLVFLGGLFGASISIAPENPYGLVAVAAIVGMFIKETLQKLKTIAGALFQAADSDNPDAKTT